MPNSKRRPTIDSPDYKALVALLRKLRADAGLQQTDLAAKLRMSQPTISKLESGEVLFDPLVLRDWCIACGVTMVELIARWEKS